MAREPESNKKCKTIHVLYIPGGGVRGVIPVMLLERLEELTETRAVELFQAFDSVSTGSIITAGVNCGLSATTMRELFKGHAPRFFPDIPARMMKMITGNIFNTLATYTDPIKADSDMLTGIKAATKLLPSLLPDASAEAVQKIDDLATQRWFTKSAQKKVLRLCDTLKPKTPEAEKVIGDLREHLGIRQTTGVMSAVFRQSALLGMEAIKQLWANNYFFDSEIPKAVFKEAYGDTRISDCLRSTYISTYDINRGEVKTTYCRKRNFFALEAGAPCAKTSSDLLLRDAVMASIANPAGYEPHVTEDGSVCTDKAIAHTPLMCITDILKNKPSDANVRLIILGTGHYFSNNIEQSLQKETYANYGLLGNIIRGKETAEIEAYSMSSARKVLNMALGSQNIIELSPRLSARHPREDATVPNTNPLDASPDNIQKIEQRTEMYIREEDRKIRHVAYMLVKNLYDMGQMPIEKYLRVIKKLGTLAGEDIPDPAPNMSAEDIKEAFAREAAKLERIFPPTSVDDEEDGEPVNDQIFTRRHNGCSECPHSSGPS